MLILLDHSTPAPLRYELEGHLVVEAVERGWERLANGALLDVAEAAGFEVFVTADKNIRHQQNLTGRKISIVALGNAQWTVLRRRPTPHQIGHARRLIDNGQRRDGIGGLLNANRTAIYWVLG